MITIKTHIIIIKYYHKFYVFMENRFDYEIKMI